MDHHWDRWGKSLDTFGDKFDKKMDDLGEKLSKQVEKSMQKPDDSISTLPPRISSSNQSADDDSSTVPYLYEAATSGQIDRLEYLFAVIRANLLPSYLEFTDLEERTPLLAACTYGHLDCVRILLDRGANHVAVDVYGNTGLHLACMHGHVDVVSLLLTHRSRRLTPYMLNKNGLSALRLARTIVQTKREGWTNVAKCIEVLEQRCKVFEGWIYHRSQSMFAWQSWEARYALVLRTGSPLFLEMHLFDVRNGLRTPIPLLVFDIDVQKPVTLYRDGDGLNRKPLAIALKNQVLAALDEAGFESWSRFLTVQASIAVHDPNLRPNEVIAARSSPQDHPLSSKTSPPPPLPPPAAAPLRKDAKQLAIGDTIEAPTAVTASAPSWDDAMPLPPATITKQASVEDTSKSTKAASPSSKKLSTISMYVGESNTAEAATVVAASAPAMEEADGGFTSTREECIVCLDRKKQTVCVPCGHVAACVPCAETIQHTTRRCPVCRTPVRELIKLFVA
ncbi:unnamed protein product [Aphanomyces euteiches]|uniref:RING-type domain-containing protein n=1 Tax=Aphanomyces euteiches TaxID=100861 RepID=A0A6G0XBG2_9STRA|nr:hypothetical protein Ae201684_006637 [Aphanomyces euteiches]KAH9091058.1 hypothetical protein Ae201684P_006459 [Aphanomyces euteiches]KAH9132152.1 hypothetical protein AeRB84_021355 [Aphanomyces euteiches]